MELVVAVILMVAFMVLSNWRTVVDLLSGGCSHPESKLTRPFMDEKGHYMRCLDCAARIPTPALLKRKFPARRKSTDDSADPEGSSDA